MLLQPGVALQYGSARFNGNRLKAASGGENRRRKGWRAVVGQESLSPTETECILIQAPLFKKSPILARELEVAALDADIGGTASPMRNASRLLLECLLTA